MIKRSRIYGLLVIACIFGSSPVLAAKKEPLTLEPSSKWVASYDDDSCRLIRKFGLEDQAVFVIFNRFGPGDDFKLVLAGKPVKLTSNRRPVTLQFGPDESVQKVGFTVGQIGPKRPALLFHGSIRIGADEAIAAKKFEADNDVQLHPISAERNAAVTYLSVGRPLRQPLILQLGPMDKPFVALSKCIDELLTHWGIDIEKYKSLTRNATPANNPGRWVVSSDYPQDMLRAGQPALVEFRLNVDKNGSATACHIQQTTRPKEFDKAVCDSVMRRAKFEPAQDSEGNPVASYYRNSVRFSIGF